MKSIDMPVEKALTFCFNRLLNYLKYREFMFTMNKISLLVLLFFLVNPVSGQNKKIEDEIILAYELRTVGKNDEAKKILEKILLQDSTNAMANFEMSRLMNATDVMNVDKSMYYCSKAAELDPENSLYAFSMADLILVKAYIAMHEENNEPQIKQLVGEACKAFQHVLEIRPDCKESMMYLVDLYGSLPEEMGGDKVKAEHYVQELEKMDKFYGARGRFILLQEDTSEIEYWKDYISDNGESNDAVELLGKAYLMSDDIENAEKCFSKIMDTDPSRQILFLHLARRYIMRIWQGKASEEEALPLARAYFIRYLSGEQEKPVSVESWCYGTLSRIEKGLGNTGQSDEYLEKAKSLNPNFSRAFAIPEVDTPPNETGYSFSSYFRPF